MTVDWLADLTGCLASGTDAMLVTVARIQGSAPREPGATMVVTADGSHRTIGGGHLEWQAIEHARQRLAAGLHQPDLVRYSLGARLGQCCGGVVWLLFEFVPAHSLDQCRGWEAALARGDSLQRSLDSSAAASRWITSAQPSQETASLVGTREDWRFVQDLCAARFPVYLFGAGHVARALVRQLLLLGATITWIDSRDDAFSGFEANPEAGHLQTLVTDAPESEVAHAPAGAYFLVMTHSHALDFTLCKAIYRRSDFAYFGLIGSKSKRAAFEHRLLASGLARERLSEMTCPIGNPGIAGKQPAAIALAVAVEIYQFRQTRQLLAKAGRTRSSDAPVYPE